jgi:8-oxo-dGTP pyrophosphatase MutT (NUDIX family)
MQEHDTESTVQQEQRQQKDSVVTPSIPSDRGVEHVLKVSQQHSLTFDPEARVDFSKCDYRAFCLLIHSGLGAAVLLHCTRKKKKAPHYQLPGGHIDGAEFKQVTHSHSAVVTQEQLYLASRIGCAREIYEETSIDLRERLDRMLPMVLYDTNNKELNDDNSHLINEYKQRLFFVCEASDEDFPSKVSLNRPH